MTTRTTTKDGERRSTNRAFMQPIINKRSNLFIETEAFMQKIICDPLTKRAIGVEYTSAPKNLKAANIAYAKKEVISSAGTLSSSKLFMVSGVGPADDLKKIHIRIIANLPIGKKLQDHVTFDGVLISLNNKTDTEVSFKQKQADLEQYLKTQAAPLANTGAATVHLFMQSKYADIDGVPDGQIFCFAKSFADVGTFKVHSYYVIILVNTFLLSPKSRGYRKLNETDPIWGSPFIYHAYHEDDSDVEQHLELIQKGLELFTTKLFKDNDYKLNHFHQPPCDYLAFNTDDYWICMMRNNTLPRNHQVGSCKMGPKEDPEAVVDPRSKVYGVSRLRVVDAAIMTNLPKGNTHAPTMMIAEKAAAMIIEDCSAKEKSNIGFNLSFNLCLQILFK